MRNVPSDQKQADDFDIRTLISRAWKYKWLYLISLAIFGALAVLYLKVTPPTYEASTTLLMDANGRFFSESQYVDGGVSLIETEKNLYNEMNILKSVGVMRKTLEDLDFLTTYYSSDLLTTREHYQDFPYEVTMIEGHPQLVDEPIYIQPISKDSYRIEIQAEEYYLDDPATNRTRFYDQPVLHTAIHTFGEIATSDYYQIVVNQTTDTFPGDAFLDKRLYFTMANMEDLIKTYQNKLKVSQVDLQASIIEVASEGEVVEKEIDFLDQLTANYINLKIEERNKIAASKESFIRQQLESIADSLNKAERNLEIFRREANAVNLTQSGMNALEKFQELQSSQAQMQLNLKYYQSLLEYLQDSAGINQIIAPSVVGIEDALLNENLLELKKLLTERTRMQYLKGPKSYDLEIIDRQINSTRASIEENVRNLIGSTTLTLNDYSSRIKNLERTIDLLPSSEKQLINYQRKTKLYENLFNYLNQELAKTGIARAENLPDITTLNYARMVGNGPVAPHPMLILLLAGLLGVIPPTVFVALKSDAHARMTHFEVLEKATDLPILTQIALDDTIKKEDTIVAAHWQAKESFRDLHANMKFFMPDYWQKVTAVTSTVPGEGKTFVASNLALSMASAGNDVLLIDADFRNPSLSRHFGVKPTKNFISYLNGWVNHPNEVIQNHEKYPKLDFITTHEARTNPHRLIQNPRFEFLILSLKDEYDHIIIDCPAVGLVSDYLLMSHLVDIHLFTTRQGVSEVAYLRDIEKFKRKGNIENLFLVYNGVPGKELKHGYFNYDSEAQSAPQKSAIRRSLSA